MCFNSYLEYRTVLIVVNVFMARIYWSIQKRKALGHQQSGLSHFFQRFSSIQNHPTIPSLFPIIAVVNNETLSSLPLPVASLPVCSFVRKQNWGNWEITWIISCRPSNPFCRFAPTSTRVPNHHQPLQRSTVEIIKKNMLSSQDGWRDDECLLNGLSITMVLADESPYSHEAYTFPFIKINSWWHFNSSPSKYASALKASRERWLGRGWGKRVRLRGVFFTTNIVIVVASFSYVRWRHNWRERVKMRNNN